MYALAQTCKRLDWIWMSPHWRLARRVLTRAAMVLLIMTLLYGVWPYSTLWRLEHAVAQNDRVTLAGLVDLDAVREEIARRLNKDQVSLIEAVSDAFIEWLESGIRQHGVEALQILVTLDWISEQFARIPTHSLGLWASISEIFFEAPNDVRIRIDRTPLAPPLILRLQLDGLTWHVTMIHD
ncbi:DUF2939 domain-containing protein [Allochromatium palmeri]|nr:DUF2939 domain-containing protein [Allochromatium palmeri]